MKTRYENNYWNQKEKKQIPHNEMYYTWFIWRKITDQDIIDTKYFYREETIHATSNFNFHDSVDWNILWYKKLIQS